MLTTTPRINKLHEAQKRFFRLITSERLCIRITFCKHQLSPTSATLPRVCMSRIFLHRIMSEKKRFKHFFAEIIHQTSADRQNFDGNVKTVSAFPPSVLSSQRNDGTVHVPALLRSEMHFPCAALRPGIRR